LLIHHIFWQHWHAKDLTVQNFKILQLNSRQKPRKCGVMMF
jgi:hypothetical protein